MGDPPHSCNLDGLVKSRKCILSVIPAKAGIQCSQALANSWTPFFNGVTTSYEILRVRARAKITSHFRISSSGHLWPRLNRKILEIVLLFLWFCSIGATKSDPNPGANSVNLFLREPLGFESEAVSRSPRVAFTSLHRVFVAVAGAPDSSTKPMVPDFGYCICKENHPIGARTTLLPSLTWQQNLG